MNAHREGTTEKIEAFRSGSILKVRRKKENEKERKKERNTRQDGEEENAKRNTEV